MIRLFIFDFDGTLCSTHEAIVYCLHRTFERYGEPPPPLDAITATIRSGIGLSETFAALRPKGLEPGDADGWASTYREFYNGGEGQARSYLFPGVTAVLAHLKERGGRLAVVSNKGEVSVRAALERYGIASYFDLAVCDRPGVARKPAPASYLQFIAPAFPDITPAETIVIGDTAADIAYARNIGARACWASYGYGDAERCSALRPDLTLNEIADLMTLVT